MKKCKLHLNYAGYCLAKASHAVKGDPHQDIQFKAMFAVIQHPELGIVLFDTGYTQRFFEATKSYPNKLYAKITKVVIDPQDEVQCQLQMNGIIPEDVKHVIVSHFHGDHVCGLKDFPNATFYCSKIAWNQVKEVSDFLAFSKGILKDLIPDNFEHRLMFFEDAQTKSVDPILGNMYDLFNDDSIQVFDVPGHAAGQVGVKLQTEKQTYLLVADACWDKRAYTDNALPSPIVKLIFHSWSDYLRSLEKLVQYFQQFPDHIIIPSHCFATYNHLVSYKITFDVL